MCSAPSHLGDDNITLVTFELQDWGDGFNAESADFTSRKLRLIDRGKLISPDGNFPVIPAEVIKASEGIVSATVANNRYISRVDEVCWDKGVPRIYFYPEGDPLFAFQVTPTLRSGDGSYVKGMTGLSGGSGNNNRPCYQCDVTRGTNTATPPMCSYSL